MCANFSEIEHAENVAAYVSSLMERQADIGKMAHNFVAHGVKGSGSLLAAHLEQMRELDELANAVRKRNQARFERYEKAV